MPAYRHSGGLFIIYGEACPPQPHRHISGIMTDLLEQIKQDSRFEPVFLEKGENIDNLYNIIFTQDKLIPTTKEEKETYGVDFKKSEDPIRIRIDIVRNYANKADMIFVLMGYSPWDYRLIELSKKRIYFTSFEECKNFVIEEVKKIVEKENL